MSRVCTVQSVERRRRRMVAVAADTHRARVDGGSIHGRAGGPSTRRRGLSGFVVQAGYIRVVDHDAVPGRAPALGFGDERAGGGFPGLRD